MLYRIILTVNVRGDPDFTKHLGLIGLVSGFEIWFGIIIACLPTLAPLVRPTVDKFVAGSSNSRPSGYSATAVPLRMLGSKNHIPGKYDQISSSNSQTRLNAMEHPVPGHGITTEVTYDPRHPPPRSAEGPNRIYVRSEIESGV